MMKVTERQSVSGTYSNGIESISFSGIITSIEADTCCGGFATAHIVLEAGSRFSWEKDDRRTLLATVVNGRIEDGRFQLN